MCVKAVLDEEEERRKKLSAEFLAKEEAKKIEFEAKLRDCETIKDKEIQKLKSELDSVRGTVCENCVSGEIENLRKQLKEYDEKRQNEIVKHRSELTSLMKEHDEIVTSARQQHIIELEALTSKFEQAREEANILRVRNESLEKQLEDLAGTKDLERIQSEVFHIASYSPYLPVYF
ncbi:hypothetical protein DICVIV_03564 [Dictyocaulus viviparus]|uniref:Uncharacterized protein n=1 Tax=Dictyocaulus viviparus TaxID=29172 RepID=A0A0D8Y6T2_DICVI|nr:hypothetical protein DICVIV_03564 [Dictyocaulus viviparus]